MNVESDNLLAADITQDIKLFVPENEQAHLFRKLENSGRRAKGYPKVVVSPDSLSTAMFAGIELALFPVISEAFFRLSSLIPDLHSGKTVLSPEGTVSLRPIVNMAAAIVSPVALARFPFWAGKDAGPIFEMAAEQINQAISVRAEQNHMRDFLRSEGISR